MIEQDVAVDELAGRGADDAAAPNGVVGEPGMAREAGGTGGIAVAGEGGAGADEAATDPESFGPGLAPERLALLLDILAEVEELPTEHPDAVIVRRATAGVYKSVKLRRRAERQDRVKSADRAVTAATATGAPTRIDDETQGLPLSSPTPTGTTSPGRCNARACYICKTALHGGRRVLPPALPLLRRTSHGKRATPAPT